MPEVPGSRRQRSSSMDSENGEHPQKRGRSGEDNGSADNQEGGQDDPPDNGNDEPDQNNRPPAQNDAPIVYDRRRPPPFDLHELSQMIVLPKLQEAMDFVWVVRNATLDDPIAKLSADALQRLRNPPRAPIDIDSPGIRHSISTYLSLEHASVQAYEGVMRSTQTNFSRAEGVDDCLSYTKVEKLIAAYTGVESIHHDMCPDSCVAFTGRFAELDACPVCNKSRWKENTDHRHKAPVKQFTTIPIGPQLQARYRDPESARQMAYLAEKTRQVVDEYRQTQGIPVIEDIAMGWDYLGAALDNDIKPNDIVLVSSLDGVQIFKDKESDSWLYIWILANISPDKRYRKLQVLPGGFIPGPKKPKNLDSFLVVGMHHLAALQHEGLTIWDASRNEVFRSDVYFLFPTADGPGLIYWDSLVGHCGKNGCRLYCGILGRRKTRQTHYYPALLKPRDRTCAGSDHPDYNSFEVPLSGSGDYAAHLKRLLSSPNRSQYEARRMETGISKPPLLLGLDPSRSLGVPICMTADIMHLAGLLSDLLITLWRGTIKCAPSDDINTWDWAVLKDEDTFTAHGAAVEDAGHHLPGSFDTKPRNIAEKINTDYKTYEFQLYTFGLGPALLYGILPKPYWTNYCMLVRGFQIMCQHHITVEEVREAYVLLASWEREFEELYYQAREDRLHFIRPCVHQVIHLAAETLQKGPPICYAQWTMERTIGNLKYDIRQPSNYQENFARLGVRRAKVNALLTAIPTLDDTKKGLPYGAISLGDGFVLLRKRDRNFVNPPDGTAQVISNFIGERCPQPLRIKRWARVQLPNGQIARSAWREKLKQLDKLRIARMIKVNWRFADVALIKLFSAADQELLALSHKTVPSCIALQDIRVIQIKNILSVVAIIPHTPRLPSGVMQDRFFVVEKPGLDDNDVEDA
ncbi:hypothetical protein HYDPIDRAFT_184253 [Hydnomerulius pinastri MD-312]|uniref:Uncharacterized protein n=1 Tax=Hydnomerulius pinastri MD-312 TaxID=994086 RepID=A0A0C9UXZ8_9AGAM|nr:hypothetical protein HYDPIDRAFT_184253 [Hydnomerulius pinastri MD-312]